jgi:hypothetical protein
LTDDDDNNDDDDDDDDDEGDDHDLDDDEGSIACGVQRVYSVMFKETICCRVGKQDSTD